MFVTVAICQIVFKPYLICDIDHFSHGFYLLFNDIYWQGVLYETIGISDKENY